MGIIKEFKEFAIKGNLVDIAIGLIIGVAFGKVVTSLVDNILMPPLGVLIGGVDFTDLNILLKEATVKNGVKVAAVTLNYGKFIQDIIDFLIIAFAVFSVVKLMNSIKKREQEQAPAPSPNVLTKDQILLAEIRDSLKNRA